MEGLWAQLTQWDIEVFLFLNNLGTESWDAFWMFITNKWNNIPVYVLCLVLMMWQLGWKETLKHLVLIALIITVVDMSITRIFKPGVARLRPCHMEEIEGMFRAVRVAVEGRCGGKYGFFSSHAANSFSFALFFGLLFRESFKWLLPVMLVWAGLVAYSRIYIGVHLFGDVLVGTLYGSLIGWGFYRFSQTDWFRKLSLRKA